MIKEKRRSYSFPTENKAGCTFPFLVALASTSIHGRHAACMPVSVCDRELCVHKSLPLHVHVLWYVCTVNKVINLSRWRCSRSRIEGKLSLQNCSCKYGAEILNMLKDKQNGFMQQRWDVSVTLSFMLQNKICALFSRLSFFLFTFILWLISFQNYYSVYIYEVSQAVNLLQKVRVPTSTSHSDLSDKPVISIKPLPICTKVTAFSDCLLRCLPVLCVVPGPIWKTDVGGCKAEHLGKQNL